MKLPNSRTENIVVQETNNELLIYDLVSNQAFCLNETSAIIFNACDGKTSVNELREQTKFSDDLILLALDELQKHNLLIGEKNDYFKGLSRRKIIRKAGLASMIALPLISTLVAPTAATAQSGGPICVPCSIDIGIICNNPAGGCTTIRVGLPCHPSCTTCACTVPNGSSSCSAVCIKV